ncbi:probable pectate lyase 12 [Ricinus communis]|uniref:Pectate lyase n=1 Tax=Ricinus communis TaxID=3988 RepID=B9S0E1_RICCO|nr:probable pectate lyase 12 [Ricinus communis]EEF42874.1 Pectate lyase precursor, putative [Ricinus communis]|eukprot:XP_002519460.1 probable pectate lyase 12 [Ricinus communis]
MLHISYIVLILLLSSFSSFGLAMWNLTFPTPHPNPEQVVQDVQRRVNASMSRRQMLQISQKDQTTCQTGNPIDDCWKCDPDWPNNRQRLADCAIGFGQYAMGGKNGEYYIVTDSSDDDAVNPKPGTLRYAVIQEEPLWIVFPSNMLIKLKEELIFNSYKTLDGRGANVHIVGGGCITLQYISNVIIHNIHIHHCVQSGDTNVRSSPTHYGYRTKSDGDGISIFGSKDIWIDHCSLSHCKDGLIDAVMGSTGITISNNFFSHHNEVMLLGHSDEYLPDSGMQVTIAFNHFGEKLVQRMPRCRRGYIHVVNNDFTQWEMYAIGGSGSPTINSQGNRYTAPSNPNAKEVTKRVDTAEGDWKGWNWRSEGDIMVNGAFFIASGEELEVKYEKAYSVEPKSAALIDLITMHAGVLGVGGRNNNLGMWSTGANGGGADQELGGSGDDYLDDYSGSSSPVSPPSAYALVSFLTAFSCLISFQSIALTSML